MFSARWSSWSGFLRRRVVCVPLVALSTVPGSLRQLGRDLHLDIDLSSILGAESGEVPTAAPEGTGAAFPPRDFLLST